MNECCERRIDSILTQPWQVVKSQASVICKFSRVNILLSFSSDLNTHTNKQTRLLQYTVLWFSLIDSNETHPNSLLRHATAKVMTALVTRHASHRYTLPCHLLPYIVKEGRPLPWRPRNPLSLCVSPLHPGRQRGWVCNVRQASPWNMLIHATHYCCCCCCCFDVPLN